MTQSLAHVLDIVRAQPVVALFLGAALLTVFLTTFLRKRPATGESPGPRLLWILYEKFSRLTWALLLVFFLVGTIAVLRIYLQRTVREFQSTHGRITSANYNAVQTIWGAEQDQGELRAEFFWEEEVTERIESEDVTKPAVLRKKIARHHITENPFISAKHDVTLRQNPRKKGSAIYGGYETDCRFTWRLRNPGQRELQANLKFPLPAETAMYDALSATLNGNDVLAQMQLQEATLILPLQLQAGEVLDLQISFTSRGMSYWYFQVKEAREIRDFTLTLKLPDLMKEDLNYPEGCMTPTRIAATEDGRGSVLTYRLDHAISGKGMGVSLPQLSQPGEVTSAVLEQVNVSWMLIVALLVLSFTVIGLPHTVLVSALFGAAVAFAYGLLGDLSDLLFGFWGTVGLLLLPLFLFLARVLTRLVSGGRGKVLALLVLIFGLAYPVLAGLDSARDMLYANACALLFLAFATWLLVGKWRTEIEVVAA
jgi:hypothetical protein